MANKRKTVYCCAECGNETSNWAGRCPACGAWNTLQEVTIETGSGKKSAVSARAAAGKAKPLSELDTSEEIRFATGISEFDRVLGGGAVAGSLVLVGGAPGIGKSTLLSRCALRREMAERYFTSPVRKVSVSSSCARCVSESTERISMSLLRQISTASSPLSTN